MWTVARRLGRTVLIFSLSMAGSYACALAFVAVETLTLPPSDHAYGRGLGSAFSDPFVRDVALYWSTAAGLLIFPIAVWAIRGRNPFVSFGICLSAALAAIAVVTPILGWLGILAGLLAVALALGWCRRSLREGRAMQPSGI